MSALKPELFHSVSDVLVGGTYKEDEVKWKMGSKSRILLLWITVAHQELVSDRLGPYLAKTPAIKAASYKSQNLCIVVNTKNFIKSFCNDFIPVEFTKKDKIDDIIQDNA